jgi:CheY-like chemotaxis protein
VDDEPAVLEMARYTLESYGYQVLLAGDGLAAIQQVAAHPEIRAVLMDLAMPRMSGDAAASRIRSLRPELPILLSSGYSEHEARTDSSAASAFLRKPYTATHLLEVIGRLVDDLPELSAAG